MCPSSWASIIARVASSGSTSIKTAADDDRIRQRVTAATTLKAPCNKVEGYFEMITQNNCVEYSLKCFFN